MSVSLDNSSGIPVVTLADGTFVSLKGNPKVRSTKENTYLEVSDDTGKVAEFAIADAGTINGVAGSSTMSTLYAQWAAAVQSPTATGYTGENVANKATDLTTNNDVKYPTNKAVNTALALKATLASPTFTGNVGGIVETLKLNIPVTGIVDGVYAIELYAEFPFTINRMKIIAGAGTCTANLKINSTSVTGISAVSVTTTIATATATAANTVAVGDKITLTLSSSTTLDYLQTTVKITRL